MKVTNEFRNNQVAQLLWHHGAGKHPDQLSPRNSTKETFSQGPYIRDVPMASLSSGWLPAGGGHLHFARKYLSEGEKKARNDVDPTDKT